MARQEAKKDLKECSHTSPLAGEGIFRCERILILEYLKNWVRGKKRALVAIPLTRFSNARSPLLALKTGLSLKGRG